VRGGHPTLIFHRNGSANATGAVYLRPVEGSLAGDSQGVRALTVERATGEVRCHSYRTERGGHMLNPREQAGFTLVEVIVALVILATAVLGLASSASQLAMSSATAELRLSRSRAWRTAWRGSGSTLATGAWTPSMRAWTRTSSEWKG